MHPKLVEELSVHWTRNCLMDRELGGYNFHYDVHCASLNSLNGSNSANLRLFATHLCYLAFEQH